MIFSGYIMYCDSLFKIARNVMSVNIFYISYIYFQNILRRITIFFLIVWKCAIITKKREYSEITQKYFNREIVFLMCIEVKILNNGSLTLKASVCRVCSKEQKSSRVWKGGCQLQVLYFHHGYVKTFWMPAASVCLPCS